MYIILSLVLSLLLAPVFIRILLRSCHYLHIQEKMIAKLQFFREEQDAWEQSRRKEYSPVA